MATAATVGYGVGGRVVIVPEVAYGTAQAVSAGIWLQFLSESIKGVRPSVEDATITGTLMVQQILPGRRSGAGDLTQNVDGDTFGYLFNKYNGNASGSYTVAAVPCITAAPTMTGGASGTNPNGAVKGKVMSVFQKSDGTLWAMGASAEASVTLSGSNGTIAWAWTNPSTITPPENYTYYGTLLGKTAVAGATNTETFMHLVIGTGASYSDTGTGYVGTGTGTLPSFTAYEHVFLPAFTPGSNPQPPVSIHKITDNDQATYFLGGRLTGADFEVGAGNEPVKAKFGFSFRDWGTEANPSYSAVGNTRKFLSWQSLISVNGALTQVVESYTISGKMTSALVPGLSGQPRYRDVGYGAKKWDLTFNRGFEDHTFVNILNSGESFACALFGVGAPMGGGYGAGLFQFSDGAGNTGYAFPFQILMDFPALVLSEAGGVIGGPAKIMEPLKAMAQLDATAGYDCRVKLYNLTSTY